MRVDTHRFISTLIDVDLRQTNKTKTSHHTVKYEVVERVEIQDKKIYQDLLW